MAEKTPKNAGPKDTADAVKDREGVTTDRAAEATVVAAGNVSAPLDDEGVVVRAEEKVEDFTSAESVEMVELTKNVYEEFYFPDTKRPSYRLLFTKGQTVPKSTVDAINAARQSDEEREAAQKANPAGIDSTTLASGTYPGVKA
jgi:hypothetical protein